MPGGRRRFLYRILTPFFGLARERPRGPFILARKMFPSIKVLARTQKKKGARSPCKEFENFDALVRAISPVTFYRTYKI